MDFYLLVQCFTIALNLWTVLCHVDHGHFWHITDLHLDQNYSRTGNPADMCQPSKKIYSDNGMYGNFLCDSPQILVDETLKSMKELHSSPDFIIWTGDNLPHSDNRDVAWPTVFQVIKNISARLSSTFPNVPIIPCIGNHDTFPPNILPEHSNSIYKGYLESGGWNTMLTEEEWPTFLKGGYFSRLLQPSLRIISVNTILWYSPNDQTANIQDPGSQFQWLEEVLKNSSKFSEKVYIIGHVPPGFYPRVYPGHKSDPTYHQHHLDTYLKILHKYCQIIIGQFYGHQHLDYFQLLSYNTGTFHNSLLLGSSVTPWHPMNQTILLPVNPSIRLIHYSKTDGKLQDYDQFFLNLTKSNNKMIKENKGLYEHLYSFTSFYRVPDLSTESFVQVYEALKRNETLFDGFFTFLSAGKHLVDCDAECKVALLCAMSCGSTIEYDTCMENSSQMQVLPQNSYHDTRHVVLVCGSVAFLLIVIAFLIFMLHRKFWNYKNQYRSFPIF